MPAKLKKLYAQLADIRARIPDMAGGRREVYENEAKSIVKQINELRADADYMRKD